MRNQAFPYLFLGLVLAGCPEPPGMEPAAGPPSGAPGASPQPMPGPVAIDGERVQAAGFAVEKGKGVTISGTVEYGGAVEGTIWIDFLRTTEADPALQHSLRVDAAGPWTVEAPVDQGALTVMAFIDTNGNGPDVGEPKVLLAEPLQVGSEDVAGVSLVIRDDWDESYVGAGAPPAAVNPPRSVRPDAGAEVPAEVPAEVAPEVQAAAAPVGSE